MAETERFFKFPVGAGGDADLPFGRTGCSLPMQWALERGVKADAFVVYTDSET